mgnify:CR=1 FL=1
MKKDITSRKDIKHIISKFYDKLLNDNEMLPYFKEIVAQNHLEKHLEIITDFWEDILFHSYNYKNNPMQKHLDFNKKIKFSKEHFTIWLNYFNTSVNEYFNGENAVIIKNRAQSIATVMQLKMNLYKK